MEKINCEIRYINGIWEYEIHCNDFESSGAADSLNELKANLFSRIDEATSWIKSAVDNWNKPNE